jgi:hypothetical protein
MACMSHQVMRAPLTFAGRGGMVRTVRRSQSFALDAAPGYLAARIQSLDHLGLVCSTESFAVCLRRCIWLRVRRF